MNDMFYKCLSLKKINISNITTEEVIDMSRLFAECKSLKNCIFQVLILKMFVICQICFIIVLH